jgi:hypothetical protein
LEKEFFYSNELLPGPEVPKDNKPTHEENGLQILSSPKQLICCREIVLFLENGFSPEGIQ